MEWTYTTDINVATSDATPATTVAAASNFWPVPPMLPTPPKGPSVASRKVRVDGSNQHYAVRRMSWRGEARWAYAATTSRLGWICVDR
jgi:hypothetical protein